jgi:hypothetical protein
MCFRAVRVARKGLTIHASDKLSDQRLGEVLAMEGRFVHEQPLSELVASRLLQFFNELYDPGMLRDGLTDEHIHRNDLPRRN